MTNLPILTPAERAARAGEKREQLLAFLAGEAWTDITTAALLLGVSANAAATTLRAMARDELIEREEIANGPRAKAIIWGITANGIAACSNAPVTTQEHRRGRLSATYLPHTIGVQRLRIIAERAGWRDWIPGRALYKAGLLVVPDALGTDAQGLRVAIELERNVKNFKRRSEVIAGHILAIAQAKSWQRVLYVCDARCDATRLQSLYMSVDKIKTSGGETEFSDKHRARFQFVNISDFKG